MVARACARTGRVRTAQTGVRGGSRTKPRIAAQWRCRRRGMYVTLSYLQVHRRSVVAVLVGRFRRGQG
jgi:hypothetical protein